MALDKLANSARLTESIGSEAAQYLTFINARLMAHAETLKRLQPKKNGAITLRLDPCDSHCLGCPHPHFYKWIDNPRARINLSDGYAKTPEERRFVFSAVRLKNPGQVLRGKQYSEQIREVYRSIKQLIEHRKRLIKALSGTKKTLAHLRKKDPDLVSNHAETIYRAVNGATPEMRPAWSHPTKEVSN